MGTDTEKRWWVVVRAVSRNGGIYDVSTDGPHDEGEAKRRAAAFTVRAAGQGLGEDDEWAVAEEDYPEPSLGREPFSTY